MYAESRLWVVLHFQTQVLEVAWRGVDAGCTEALFTLGDKPELLYPQAKQEVGAIFIFIALDPASKLSKE